MAQLLLLLLCATLLSSGRAKQSAGNYLVSVPAKLHALSSERLCVSLLSVAGDVTLGATLHYPDSQNQELNTINHTVVEDTLLHPSPQGNVHQCFTFQVPDVEMKSVVELVVTAHGSGLSFSHRHKLIVQKPSNVVFIQTDKPIYKPGQSVKFRVVTLDENFSTVLQTYDLIYIEDPQQNRIEQWRNVIGHAGIVQLSIQMQSEPPQGSYRIAAFHADKQVATHSFTIKEYVLPTFEVSIRTPPYLTYVDKTIKLSICGRYTYGKPVHGLVNASACIIRQSAYWWRGDCSSSSCQQFQATVGRDGCVDWLVENTKLLNHSCSVRQLLKVSATLEEEGTEIKMKNKVEKMFQKEIFKMSFQDVTKWFRPGLPIEGKVKMERPDGSPMPDKLIKLSVRQNNENGSEFHHRTGADGSFSFSLETQNFNNFEMVFLEAKDPDFNASTNPSVGYDPAYNNLDVFYSPSGSFLQLLQTSSTVKCGASVSLNLQLLLNKNGSGGGQDGEAVQAIVNVLVMSRGNIRHTDTFTLENVALGKMHSHHYDLEIRSEFSPSARVLVWMIFNNETVADSIHLSVHKCFPNQVSVGFAHEQEAPGASSTLSIHAAPNSVCALRVVDRSVLLLKPEAQLSADTIFQGISNLDLSNYDHKIQGPICYQNQSNNPMHIYYMPWFHQSSNNVYSLFKNMGLVVLTDTTIRKWLPCTTHTLRHSYYMQEPMVAFSQGNRAGEVGMRRMEATPGNKVEEVEKMVREYFPETWIWDLYPVSESGSEQVAIKVPDTITEWKASAFCTSPTGFGLSDVSSLTVFTPFFVEPVLPYSVVRGEIFPLTITVHNYLLSCLKIEVVLPPSEQFAVPVGHDRSFAHCVCPDRKGLFVFLMQPLSLGLVNVTVRAEAVPSEEPCGNEFVVVPDTGAVDTVVRSIIVKPEGIPKDLAFSSLLCPKPSAAAVGTFNLSLPANVIPGSARAYLTIAGDIMGAALQNLDKLLTLPTGCGEQNMVKFAPNIYIQEYLQNSGQLTDKVRETAINFLRVGYQRQLTYKHDDHSYSAFGKNDEEGNTWLTAFVLKSFVRASKHISVAEKDISGPLGWLSEHQNVSTGCFISVGRLFNNAMKGGVADDVSLTAFVAAALLESNITGPVVERALACLRPRVSKSSSTYLLALSAYAFELSSDSDTATALSNTLESLAIKKDRLVHWSEAKKSQDDKDDDDDDDDDDADFPAGLWRYYKRATSAAVETTAYTLLSRLAGTGPSSGIDANIGAVQWLIKQRNALGGFSSTQDTVVGLQALSVFAGLMHGGGGGAGAAAGMKASVFDAAHTPLQDITIDKSNALVLHHIPLPALAPAVPTSCFVEATGDGCVLFQVSLKYNEPLRVVKPKFTLFVETYPANCSKAARKSFSLHIQVSYHGERGDSNMALVEVNMVSGHSPVKASLKQLQSSHSFVKKFEVDANKAVIYLDKVDKETISLSLSVIQDIAVDNLQPASVKVYDYYATEDSAISQYNAPCTQTAGSKVNGGLGDEVVACELIEAAGRRRTAQLRGKTCKAAVRTAIASSSTPQGADVQCRAYAWR